jgi:hypothetical protein
MAAVARVVHAEPHMKFMTAISVGFVVGSSFLCLAGHAQERAPDHARPAPPPPRHEPPPFQAHPAGVHPHGATVRNHPIRVLAPKVVVHGRTGWNHWDHPEIARPVYYWTWPAVHNVTCVAEDSYGDQYPVSEAASPGFGLANMTDIEEDALDRCYNESGQDTTCVLATCTHN